MDVNLNYTCLYSPSCDDCTVAINLSLWTMFLFILPPLSSLCALLAAEWGVWGDVARLQSFIGGMVRNGDRAQPIRGEMQSFAKFFFCVEKICVCLCARAGVCVKRDVSTAGLLRLG